jgi:hypothetical protein
MLYWLASNFAMMVVVMSVAQRVAPQKLGT